MRNKIFFIPQGKFVFAAFAAWLAFSGIAHGVDFTTQTQRPTFVADEVLVTFKAKVQSFEQSQIIATLGAQKVNTDTPSHFARLKLNPGDSVEDTITALKSDTAVASVQPNYLYYTMAIPNDTGYGELWGLKNNAQTVSNPSYATNNPGISGKDMDLELAWDNITDCSSVVVAVLDTSLNYTHQDLAANMWNGNANHGMDFVGNNDLDPMATDGQTHATHVAGTIGAVGNNAVGSSGVCWQVQLMAVRVLGDNGGGTTVDVIEGIEFAADNGAKVINMSLGGGGGFDQLYSDAITYAQDRDVVVVVAAGNNGTDNEVSALWPCNFTHDNLVCVAALDQSYSRASFSNFGATSVDVGAPGTNIRSAWPGAKVPPDDFTGWTQSSTGGSTWANVLAGPSSCDPNDLATLNIPADWCKLTGNDYSNSTFSTIWKEFNLSGLLGAGVSYSADIDTTSTEDLFRTLSKSTGGNPTGTTLLQAGSGSTSGDYLAFEHGLSGCLTSTCSIGFELESDATTTAKGIGVISFAIQKTESNSNVYETINGTSMATPHVAGIAAMLRAYNPNYTYRNVVNSIINGGESVSALASPTATTSGKAVNAMGSLSYINVPTGVSAVVQ
ncbi:S8 family serine peptidase [Beggiatoa alba]|nr:S8 family serine peptidase [Beggiatoa alba]